MNVVLMVILIFLLSKINILVFILLIKMEEEDIICSKENLQITLKNFSQNGN